MNNTMEYKGYVGTIEFSEEDMLFYGKVQGIRSLISYEGSDANELVNDFHNAVDTYLENCKREGKEPEVAYKGTLNVRLSADTHRRAAIYAMNHGQSLNSLIDMAIREKLGISNPDTEITREGAINALHALRGQAKRNGISDMSFSEINKEIRASRAERKQ